MGPKLLGIPAAVMRRLDDDRSAGSQCFMISFPMLCRGTRLHLPRQVSLHGHRLRGNRAPWRPRGWYRRYRAAHPERPDPPKDRRSRPPMLTASICRVRFMPFPSGTGRQRLADGLPQGLPAELGGQNQRDEDRVAVTNASRGRAG